MRGRGLQERNARILARQPLCMECLKIDVVRPSTQVDHVIPLHMGGPDTEDNLQGLCDPCHLLKSAEEAQARAHREPL
jgi:5-methylcytosine-specific restriction enzyme A